MKREKIVRDVFKLEVFVLLFLGLGLSNPSPVSAQIKPLTEPTEITVVGMRGSVVTRNLFLRTANPIAKLNLIPLDLNGSDGGTVLPAQAIALENITPDGQNANAVAARLKVNLTNANSGEFKGALRLSYQGGEQVVPVTIRVKDHWFFPLASLLLGTILGVSVSMYRAQGRPRDEILLRVSQLRVQMQEDSDLDRFHSFKSRLDALLVDIRTALQGEQWEVGQNLLQQADLTLNKWIKGREDWLAQLEYNRQIKEQIEEQLVERPQNQRQDSKRSQEQLEKRIADLSKSFPFVQIVERDLEDALRDAPDLESPRSLRDRLQGIAETVNAYLPLVAQLKQLLELNEKFWGDEGKEWQPKIQNLKQRVLSLRPADLATDETLKAKDPTLEADLGSAIAELTQQFPQSRSGDPSNESFAVNSGGSLWGSMTTILGPAPSTRPLTWEEQIKGANTRLQIFTTTSYAIAILLLAGAGFSQLYLDKPTFGDNRWKDYFSLLAWGFGAEATRDAVTKVVQGWSLPGLK